MKDINNPEHPWETRMKSWLVKCLIKSEQDPYMGLNEIAECLGVSTSYLNTKLARNSFSFDDILAIATAVGAEISISFPDGYSPIECQDIDSFSYLGRDLYNKIEEVRTRTWTTKCDKESKYLEYKQKKKELEEIKALYKFKD